MNCEEIQDRLSEYLDRSLPADVAAALDKHLEACTTCEREAELLRKTIVEIAKLPTVEPPLRFSQRVMVCVREAELQPTLWQRLLVPLQWKVPLRATAVLIVGVLGIYVFQKDEAPQSGPELPPTPPAFLTPENLPSPGNQGTTAFTTLPNTSASAPDASRESPARAAADPTRAEPREATLETTRREPVFSGTPVAVPAPGQAGDSPVPFRGRFHFENPFRSTPGSIELFADYELVVRRHADDIEKREALARRSEAGEVIGESSPTPRAERLMAAIPDRSRLQTIWISVPRNQYEQFKQELRALGTIVSEVRVPLFSDQTRSRSDGPFHVKLTALPAGEGSTPEQ